jgi:hypothetical protein
MGWTFSHKDKSESVKSFFEKRFNYQSAESNSAFKLLDCKVVAMKTAYLAIELTRKSGVAVTFAVVCLLDYQPKAHFNFGYKDMEESMNPYYYDCPQSILDLLTPTTNEDALAWRAKCKEVANQKKVAKTLQKGDVIKFKNELKFGSFGYTDTFTVIDPKKGHFSGLGLKCWAVKLTKNNLCNSNNPWVKIEKEI